MLYTDRLYRQWLNSVIDWFVSHCTDQHDVFWLPVQFNFMMSSVTYSVVTLTLEGMLSFLQLMDVQNVQKNTCLVQTRFTGNSKALFKIVESYRL